MIDKKATREADKSLKSLKWSKLVSGQNSLIVESLISYIIMTDKSNIRPRQNKKWT